MPVHEIKYRTWEGELTPPVFRLLSIPKFTLLSVWSKYATLALFSGGIQFLLYSGYLLLITNPLVRELANVNVEQMQSLLLPDWRIFQNFFLVQFFICMMLCLFLSPKMISTERANRALPLIYSRPVSRMTYITGKFLALAIPMSLITWIEAAAIFLMMMLFYPAGSDFWNEFWTDRIFVGLSAIFMGLLLSISMSLFFLACSSATTNHMYATAIPLALLFGASLVTQFIQTNVMTLFPDLGLRDMFMSTSYLLLEPEPNTDISVIAVALGYTIWIVASIAFMLWRLRPVDVYED